MSVITYMLLHNYLEDLLQRKVIIRVVRTLLHYPGKIFTVRKLAEAAGASVSETAVVVQDLEKYGILTIQPVGKAYLVSLNDRSYILNKVLKPLLTAEERTQSELFEVLKMHLTNTAIASASVFGSVASKQARKDSDIDILIVSDCFEQASASVSRAQDDVTSIFNGRLSPLIVSRTELKMKQRSPLFKSIMETYMHVAGKDLKKIGSAR